MENYKDIKKKASKEIKHLMDLAYEQGLKDGHESLEDILKEGIEVGLDYCRKLYESDPKTNKQLCEIMFNMSYPDALRAASAEEIVRKTKELINRNYSSINNKKEADETRDGRYLFLLDELKSKDINNSAKYIVTEISDDTIKIVNVNNKTYYRIAIDQFFDLYERTGKNYSELHDVLTYAVSKKGECSGYESITY